MAPAGPTIRRARTSRDQASVRTLVLEYAAAYDLGRRDPSFAAELAGFPGEYQPPAGGLWLLRVSGEVAGCGALRRLSDTEAEAKRLYLRPEFRGRGLGRRLTSRLLREAGSLGYRAILLDTLPEMTEAHALYESLGFREVAPYHPVRVPGTRYFRRALGPPPQRDMRSGLGGRSRRA